MLSDEEIVQGIKACDETSFDLLFERYSKCLLRHIYKITLNLEISEEILNEVFLTVVKKIDSFKGGNLKAWIYRIATNESIDYLRKRKRNQSKEKCEIDETSFHQDSYRNDSEVIMSLIQKLPALQRMAINMKVNDEMSYKEMASICGCSIESIKQALFKGRSNLKIILKENGIEV